MSVVLINPHAGELGVQNAVLAGRSSQYDVRNFTGPLSVKSVVGGRATWMTATGTFVVGPGSALVVNSGEAYDITIDALQPVETFCIFFRRGFFEDAYRSASSASGDLIDAMPADREIEIGQRMIYTPAIVDRMRAAHERKADRDALGEHVVELARALVCVACDVDRRVAALPALRPATRRELRKRIARAIDYVHANIGSPMTLDEVSGAACLSPFHFHRIFTALHGETPHRYIRRIRLERARALLRGSRGVADVALECGFESVGSFTTLFAKTFGTTPGRLRMLREDQRRVRAAEPE